MTPVEYTEWWLKYAMKELRNNPASELHHFTNQKWEQWIDQVYFYPSSLEECTLRSRVHEVLLVAFHNAIKKAEELRPKKWNAGNCMDVTEAYCLALMIGQIDPIYAVQMKVRLNNLANRFNETVERFAGETKSILISVVTVEW